MGPRLRSRATAIATLALLALLFACSSASAAARHRGGHVAMASAEATCLGAGTPVGTVPIAQTKASVVCLLNFERTSLGLQPLREDRRLDRAAQGWTSTMVTDQLFSHGRNFAARLSQAGYGWSSAGEDIAAGFNTPTSVVTAWMASYPHCHNILDPNFVAVGTGVVGRGIGQSRAAATTWTEDFAAPTGASLSGNWSVANSRC
jgi:uncharacterized protein YkwD